MKRLVLVLNQDYSPLTVCSAQRAILLLFLDKAEILSEAVSISLRTVSHVYAMPAVIRIFRYVNLPYRGVALTRNNVFKRDRNECQYCGTYKDLTIDHVVPQSKGGKSSWHNLVTACKRCNARKGDKSPEEAGLRLKKVPIKPSYAIFLKEFSESKYREWEPFLVGQT
jgi:5-methylcytosine-specific restriction endonuclease McrA